MVMRRPFSSSVMRTTPEVRARTAAPFGVRASNSSTTLAFAVATASWIFTFKVFTLSGPVVRPRIFGIFDVSGERAFFLLTFVFVVLALLGTRNLRNSRAGRVLVAMRDNERGAQALGVPRVRTKLAAFASSGFVAAVAGALYAYHQQQLRPDRFPAYVSIFLFSIV